MAAPGAASPGRECVPRHAASLEERLGSPDTVTAPEARGRGAPAAERTSDAAERILVVWFGYLDCDLVRRPAVFQEHSQWHKDLRPSVRTMRQSFEVFNRHRMQPERPDSTHCRARRRRLQIVLDRDLIRPRSG